MIHQKVKHLQQKQLEIASLNRNGRPNVTSIDYVSANR
jgi:hypothetical protein